MDKKHLLLLENNQLINHITSIIDCFPTTAHPPLFFLTYILLHSHMSFSSVLYKLPLWSNLVCMFGKTEPSLWKHKNLLTHEGYERSGALHHFICVILHLSMGGVRMPLCSARDVPRTKSQMSLVFIALCRRLMSLRLLYAITGKP